MLVGVHSGFRIEAHTLSSRAVEFLEHWRLYERPFEVSRGQHFFSHQLRIVTSGVSVEQKSISKLALEFDGAQEYSEVTLVAVDAVVRDMNSQQTLAIA